MESPVSPNRRLDHSLRETFTRDGPRHRSSARHTRPELQRHPRYDVPNGGQLQGIAQVPTAATNTTQQQQKANPDLPPTALSGKRLSTFRSSLKILQDYAKFYEHMHKGPKPTPEIHFQPNLQVQLPEGFQGSTQPSMYGYQQPPYGQNPNEDYWQRPQGMEADMSSGRSPYTMSPSTDRGCWTADDDPTFAPQTRSEKYGVWEANAQEWQQLQDQRPDVGPRRYTGYNYNIDKSAVGNAHSLSAANLYIPAGPLPGVLKRQLTDFERRQPHSPIVSTQFAAPLPNAFALSPPSSFQNHSTLDRAAAGLSAHLLHGGRRSAMLAIQAARDYVRDYHMRPGISKLEDCVWELFRILDRGVFAGRLGDEVLLDWQDGDRESGSKSGTRGEAPGEKKDNNAQQGSTNQQGQSCCFGVTFTSVQGQKLERTNITTTKRIAIYLDRRCCTSPEVHNTLDSNGSSKPANTQYSQSSHTTVVSDTSNSRRRRRPRRAFSSLPALASNDTNTNTNASSRSCSNSYTGQKRGDDLIVVLLHHMLHAFFLCTCRSSPPTATPNPLPSALCNPSAASGSNNSTPPPRDVIDPSDKRLKHSAAFWGVMDAVAQVAAETDERVRCQTDRNDEVGVHLRSSAAYGASSSARSTVSSTGSSTVSGTSGSEGPAGGSASNTFTGAMGRVHTFRKQAKPQTVAEPAQEQRPVAGVAVRGTGKCINGDGIRVTGMQQGPPQQPTQFNTATAFPPTSSASSARFSNPRDTNTRRHSSYTVPITSFLQPHASPTGLHTSSRLFSDPETSGLFPTSNLEGTSHAAGDAHSRIRASASLAEGATATNPRQSVVSPPFTDAAHNNNKEGQHDHRNLNHSPPPTRKPPRRHRPSRTDSSSNNPLSTASKSSSSSSSSSEGRDSRKELPGQRPTSSYNTNQYGKDRAATCRLDSPDPDPDPDPYRTQQLHSQSLSLAADLKNLSAATTSSGFHSRHPRQKRRQRHDLADTDIYEGDHEQSASMAHAPAPTAPPPQASPSRKKKAKRAKARERTTQPSKPREVIAQEQEQRQDRISAAGDASEEPAHSPSHPPREGTKPKSRQRDSVKKGADGGREDGRADGKADSRECEGKNLRAVASIEGKSKSRENTNSSSDPDADDHLYMRRLARRQARRLARELGT
ncbi:MAG: hypothetical protein M1831_004358 [Alyxoria varia]|nr:MAG: hypothetical protein M1831_004358 [Alyxoria varia]